MPFLLNCLAPIGFVDHLDLGYWPFVLELALGPAISECVVLGLSLAALLSLPWKKKDVHLGAKKKLQCTTCRLIKS